MTILDVTQILEAMEAIPGFEAGRVHLASLETLRHAYNGCGPERWPKELREKLDDVTMIFAPAFLVHDLDFEQSDGTEDKMCEANERLHRNTRRIVRWRYPFWTWRMFRLSYRLQRARAVALMVAINLATNDVLTRQAWLESNARRQLNSGEENW